MDIICCLPFGVSAGGDAPHPRPTVPASYGRTMTNLTTAVRFDSGVWQSSHSYADIGWPLQGGIYGTLSQPAAPMGQPWVGVLAHACNWAKGTTQALAAMTALTESTYTSCTYNGGYQAWASFSTDDAEEFQLAGFLGACPRKAEQAVLQNSRRVQTAVERRTGPFPSLETPQIRHTGADLAIRGQAPRRHDRPV